MGAYIWYFLRLIDDSPAVRNDVCSETAHRSRDIGKRFSLHPRYLYHLRWNSGTSFRKEKRVGMDSMDNNRSDAKSRAVFFISRSFPAISKAKCRLLFNESVLTFRIWRWVYVNGT